MLKKFKELHQKEYKLTKTQKFFVYLLVFVIACIIGWIYEVIFTLLFDHVFENRGFLYGPYVPVYGFGAIIMLPLLKRFKKNPLIIFFLAILITGVVEYVVGAWMWALYQQRWWDYTGLFLNINGYVCLRSVLTFAIGALMLFYIIEPLVSKLAKKTKNKTICITTLIILLVFVTDLVLTLIFRNPL